MITTIKHGSARIEVLKAFADGSGVELKVTALSYQFAVNFLAEVRLHPWGGKVPKDMSWRRERAIFIARKAVTLRLNDILRAAGQDPEKWLELNRELYR